MAALVPQHDDEGRSATILPGVPLPEWALPAGPIAPEPDPAEEAAAAAAAAAAGPAPSAPPLEAPAPVQELVLAGAPLREAPSVPDLEPPSAYGAPLPIGGNGPGPMRAGWDYPGSDFREQAHDEAVAEAAAAEIAAPVGLPVGPPLEAPLALAMTQPVPVLAPPAAPAPAVAGVLAGMPAPLAPAPAGDPVIAPAPLEQVAATEAPAADVPLTDEVQHDVVGEPQDESEVPEGSPSSRRNLVALGALGAVVVAGAVAAFVWPGLLVSSDPEPVPVVPPVSAPAAAAPAALTTPASVGQYAKITGAPAVALTKAVSGSALPGLSTPVSAVYGTGTTPAVTVIAWNSATPVGASAIPSAFAGFQGATSAVVTDITTTPVSASGEMQCGTTLVSGAPATLCFWADDATFGSVTVLKPTSPESAADTATAVRAAVVGS